MLQETISHVLHKQSIAYKMLLHRFVHTICYWLSSITYVTETRKFNASKKYSWSFGWEFSHRIIRIGREKHCRERDSILSLKNSKWYKEHSSKWWSTCLARGRHRVQPWMPLDVSLVVSNILGPKQHHKFYESDLNPQDPVLSSVSQGFPEQCIYTM